MNGKFIRHRSHFSMRYLLLCANCLGMLDLIALNMGNSRSKEKVNTLFSVNSMGELIQDVSGMKTFLIRENRFSTGILQE